MAVFDSKPQFSSAWATVAHAGKAEPVAGEPASGLATLLQQGAIERQQQSGLGWFDVEFVNFSANTLRFLSITEGDIRTGLRHSTRHVGKLLYQMGATREEFKFADPVNDVRQIKRGIVRWLRPVSDSEILKMLTYAGVFDYHTKTTNNSIWDRYSFIEREGQGEGCLDFSMTYLKLIATMKKNYVTNEDDTPFLFFVAGAAHNWYNFGNFLFGAAGAALGITESELRLGAHYNSVVNSEKNGYPSQLDSDDDQFSISEGFAYAKRRNYTSRIQRQWGQHR
jgi:hypothetical protein